MSGLIDGARLALSTFTVLPAGSPPTDRRTAGIAMSLAPLVGVVVALPAAAVMALARTGQSASALLLPAVLAVVVTTLTTRGLHLDGLADTVDGLGSSRPPDEARVVMRRPDVGPFGVVAVVLVLLTQVAALTAATERGFGTVALCVSVVTGRLAVTLACIRGVPAADPTGLGAAVAGTVRRSVAAAVTAAVLVASTFAGALDGDGGAAREAVRTVAAVVIGITAARLLRAHCVRRLGGVTGDVLGALVEAATTVSLLVMAI